MSSSNTLILLRLCCQKESEPLLWERARHAGKYKHCRAVQDLYMMLHYRFVYGLRCNAHRPERHLPESRLSSKWNDLFRSSLFIISLSWWWGAILLSLDNKVHFLEIKKFLRYLGMMMLLLLWYRLIILIYLDETGCDSDLFPQDSSVFTISQSWSHNKALFFCHIGVAKFFSP